MKLDLQTKETPVVAKTKELCQTIVDQPQFAQLLEAIEAFMGDDHARTLYENLTDKQQELIQKQERGGHLTDDEIADYEQDRAALLAHPVASAFIDARQHMQKVQDTIQSYVNRTFELGRVPMDDELSSGGCCGGQGGGCGCQ